MTDTTMRDLARIGAQCNEGGTELFKTALYALSSSQTGTVGSDDCAETVAAQVHAEADCSPDQAEEYVRAFIAAFEIASLSDVDDLLGRQSFVEANYAGQKAFVSPDEGLWP